MAEVKAELVGNLWKIVTEVGQQVEPRGVGDRAAGSVREARGVPDDEARKGEARVEPAVALVGKRHQRGVVLRKRLRFVRRRCSRWVDRYQHVAVAAEETRERFANQRDVALCQPIAREPRGHAERELMAVRVDEDSVREPCLVARTRQLKAQLLLRDLPDLLRIERCGGGEAVALNRQGIAPIDTERC